ncbi:hypothetical protein JIN85_05535 [Luteolibacter pohnpeiensis]|uniref:Uncharacterized protein n=1 Tax=Luteolibacter pohnpeiensis TaxID=454153 RepID=A0A934S5X9_9BACT|nr:hypothetical protein [Luteolibacter pohnpeiensis]MBK1881865.1 hypothetical protein [Luteolibacter pohnpeiensis]
MSPLLEALIANNLPLNMAGVLGLGLIGLAAARLSHQHRSKGGTVMTWGAICLLLARMYVVSAPHFENLAFFEAIGPVGIAATIALPPLLLSVGLAAVVWGLWAHERLMRNERR